MDERANDARAPSVISLLVAKSEVAMPAAAALPLISSTIEACAPSPRCTAMRARSDEPDSGATTRITIGAVSRPALRVIETPVFQSAATSAAVRSSLAPPIGADRLSGVTLRLAAVASAPR